METRPSRRWRCAQFLIGLLLLNSAIVYAFKGADFVYLTNVMLHLALGLVGAGGLLASMPLVIRWLRSRDDGAVRLCCAAALFALIVCLGTGVYLLVFGAMTPQKPVLALHRWGTFGTLLFGCLAWLRHAAIASPARRGVPRAWAATVLVCMPPILVSVRALLPSPEKRVTNPRWAPESPNGEGDGPSGRFFPSSVQTVGDKFFPSEYYTDSASCGARGCHPDIFAQWQSSAHRNSSFNNQWYRKSVEYMQDVNGAQSSKWCGGCHDMAVLQTEKPGTGKSRMDFPIKDQMWPPEKFPESHAGIGCAACHSIVHVKSTMGQGDFKADYPAMHKYAISKEPLMKFMHDFLIRRAPEPHKRTFLKPFHREDTAKFCSSCHKVHLDMPVNNYRWFRGFNDYDAWQNSGVSGGNARAFYYPADGFKKCADCHMPRVKSNDAANKNGFVRSHRFLAANTALPFVNGDREQLALTEKFLKEGPPGIKPDGVSAVTVDVFALRRKVAGSTRQVVAVSSKPHPVLRIRRTDAVGREQSMIPGESGVVESSPRISRATSAWGQPEVIDERTTIRPGETVLIEVVARTRKVGHFFPGGTVDAFDVWLELECRGSGGHKVFHSGALEYPDGPLKKDTHEYRSLMLDAGGNRINKRNAWASRTAAYARLIPPGAADTAHFRFTMPKGTVGPVSFTARMNYRKFDWWNTQFAFAGRPRNSPELVSAGASDRSRRDHLFNRHYDSRAWSFDADTSQVSGNMKSIPRLPVIVMAEDRKSIAASFPPPTLPIPHSPFPLPERWNDYGIGLYLQKDFRTAELAFRNVIALDPKWPEGYVNAARVQHDEGDLDGAVARLQQALALHEKRPLNSNRAKVHYFLGSSLFQLGDFEGALAQLRHARTQFPDDRVVRNLIGTLHFRQGEFDRAIAEFEHTLSIDPEDLTAHYHLMLCYRGKGDLPRSAREEKLYRRFKADESASNIAGPYLQRNPHDNNEARLIHEHGG